MAVSGKVAGRAVPDLYHKSMGQAGDGSQRIDDKALINTDLIRAISCYDTDSTLADFDGIGAAVCISEGEDIRFFCMIQRNASNQFAVLINIGDHVLLKQRFANEGEYGYQADAGQDCQGERYDQSFFGG